MNSNPPFLRCRFSQHRWWRNWSFYCFLMFSLFHMLKQRWISLRTPCTTCTINIQRSLWPALRNEWSLARVVRYEHASLGQQIYAKTGQRLLTWGVGFAWICSKMTCWHGRPWLVNKATRARTCGLLWLMEGVDTDLAMLILEKL